MSETPDTETSGAPEVDLAKQFTKLGLELGPLVIFFLTNSYKGIFWATGTFMVAVTISLVLSRIIFHKIPIMPLITAVFVLVFGGLTLYLQDELFIKLKPTIVNVLFGTILLGCLTLNQLVFKVLFADAFSVTDTGWRKLQFRWGLFFLFLAVLNEIVWRNFSTDMWVNFKVFGLMPLTLIFSLTTLPILQAHELPASPAPKKE